MNNLTANTYENAIKDAPLPMVIDFWADWCQPCLKFATLLPAIGKQLEGVADIYKVDIEGENNQYLAEKYNIKSIPTVVVVEPVSGQVLLQFNPQGSVKEIVDLIQESIMPDTKYL